MQEAGREMRISCQIKVKYRLRWRDREEDGAKKDNSEKGQGYNDAESKSVPSDKHRKSSVS